MRYAHLPISHRGSQADDKAMKEMEDTDISGPKREAGHGERGFSLIELLVVIVIISILAAISIPLFFRQREKGFVAQSESALKNAATAMQAYSTDHDGAYPAANPLDPNPQVLIDEGFREVTDVAITIESSDSEGYCLEAAHSGTSKVLSYDSDVGRPVEVPCS
jgi:prepilin-type N-terminal cleavage/methylation domain-containing protein